MQPFWMILLASHVAAAAVWWWVMPAGIAAPLLMVVLAAAVVARGRVSETIVPPILAAIPVFWIAFAISARIVFFESFRSLWTLPFIGGVGVALMWMRRFRFQVRPVWLVPVAAGLAALLGWMLPDTQRAPDAATAPAGAPLPETPAGRIERRMVKLGRDAQLHPEDGRLVIRRDKLVLNVGPLLSFADHSPDRCWVALAPDELAGPTTRKLTASVHEGASWRLFYKDEDRSELEVRDDLQLEARSRLGEAVFSHLNSFAELTVQGHQKLTVSFSPVQARIEVPPVTAPARFAYLDESGTFHVVQASTFHRGPFTEIAAGRLERKDPLVITIYDAGQPAFAVRFEDWAAQASTQRSPTSGLPANAIELQRGGEAESTAALISLSLASTSIGRGTQSVGHTAGVYRNRLTVTLPAREK
jgi:hypothetical protein